MSDQKMVGGRYAIGDLIGIGAMGRSSKELIRKTGKWLLLKPSSLNS